MHVLVYSFLYSSLGYVPTGKETTYVVQKNGTGAQDLSLADVEPVGPRLNPIIHHT